MKRKQNLLLWLVIGAVMLGLTVLAADWYRAGREKPVVETEEPDDGRISYRGKTYVPNTALQTLLLIGTDRAGDEEKLSYNNQQQCDFLLLLVLDQKKESFFLLHLNRDTLCDIPTLDLNGNRIGYRCGQLALAHTYGTGGKDSCINTVKAVSRLLYDVELGSYARIPVEAVAVLNDAVGGVTVTVEDDFSGVDASLVMGETVCLTGKQAETFIRARGGMEDSSNLRRMERQRQYIQGLLEKLRGRGETNLLEQVRGALGEQLTTDLSAARLSQLGQLLEQYTFAGILTLPGTAAQGEEFMEYTVDADALQQLVVERFYRPLE